MKAFCVAVSQVLHIKKICYVCSYEKKTLNILWKFRIFLQIHPKSDSWFAHDVQWGNLFLHRLFAEFTLLYYIIILAGIKFWQILVTCLCTILMCSLFCYPSQLCCTISTCFTCHFLGNKWHNHLQSCLISNWGVTWKNSK